MPCPLPFPLPLPIPRTRPLPRARIELRPRAARRSWRVACNAKLSRIYDSLPGVITTEFSADSRSSVMTSVSATGFFKFFLAAATPLSATDSPGRQRFARIEPSASWIEHSNLFSSCRSATIGSSSAQKVPEFIYRYCKFNLIKSNVNISPSSCGSASFKGPASSVDSSPTDGKKTGDV
jgi:hypothetical protein